MKTLLEIQSSSVLRVLGVCPNSTEGLTKINDATERLMDCGDWPGLIVPTQFCIYSGCIVLNRYILQVRKLNICACPVGVQNMWGNFQSRACGCHTGCHGRASATDYGSVPTFDSIRGEGRLVRVYTRCQADLGRAITIFGIGNDGQPLMTRNANDSWTEGITLALASPFASTSVFVRRIDRVIRETTQCITDMFAYWAAEDVLEPLASYEASETTPQYDRLQVHAGCAGTCNGVKSVTALVKLRFIPARLPTDLVLIDNVSALSKMIQAVDYEQAGDIAKAEAYEVGAIRALNRQLGNIMPLDQLPINISTFNNARGIGCQHVF